MTENTSIQPSITQSSAPMLKAMVGIGLICALLIVLTYESTKPRIEKLKAEALEEAIFKVLPGISSTKSFTLKNNHFVAGKSTGESKTVYAGYDATGNLKGIAIEASGTGYADIIRILYGYDPNLEKVVGFYVLESKETPGLGDKIEKDEDFLSNFKALDVSLSESHTSLKNQVVPVKHGNKTNDWQIDGISGATISSRTVGEIMQSSTSYWIPLIYQNKEDFIE